MPFKRRQQAWLCWGTVLLSGCSSPWYTASQTRRAQPARSSVLPDPVAQAMAIQQEVALERQHPLTESQREQALQTWLTAWSANHPLPPPARHQLAAELRAAPPTLWPSVAEVHLNGRAYARNRQQPSRTRTVQWETSAGSQQPPNSTLPPHRFDFP